MILHYKNETIECKVKDITYNHKRGTWGNFYTTKLTMVVDNNQYQKILNNKHNFDFVIQDNNHFQKKCSKIERLTISSKFKDGTVRITIIANVFTIKDLEKNEIRNIRLKQILD